MQDSFIKKKKEKQRLKMVHFDFDITPISTSQIVEFLLVLC